MKATGVVRKIDDLGRIVIPKEIRRTLRVREGEPLEIFTDRDGQIILKKYSPMGEMGTFARQYAEALAQSSGYTVCISDKDTIIAASGKGRKELQDKAISPELEQFMQQRQVLLAAKESVAIFRSQQKPRCTRAKSLCPLSARGTP